ncbi:MAG: hypothetical protein EBT07_01545 [Actinobacteria bacterium]|nr:hypothetical protein [Actinomycetota bacterium]
MSNEPLSHEQFAAHVAEEGGGSVGFFSRVPVSGKGFMTAITGSEKVQETPVSAHDIGAYAEKNAPVAASIPNPSHGVWGTTQDVSVQAETPNRASSIGEPTGEQASFGLPRSRVSARGHNMGAGGDVLLHTADLGKNDTDPRYRPGALDEPGRGSFTRNQYQNKDWEKSLGTLNGQKITYGDVLRTINKHRAAKKREEYLKGQ